MDGRVLDELRTGEWSKSGLATKLSPSSVTGQLNRYIAALIEKGLIEMTVRQAEQPTSEIPPHRDGASRGREGRRDAMTRRPKGDRDTWTIAIAPVAILLVYRRATAGRARMESLTQEMP